MRVDLRVDFGKALLCRSIRYADWLDVVAHQDAEKYEERVWISYGAVRAKSAPTRRAVRRRVESAEN